MAEIELRHAWEWTCDDCGKDNFERALSEEVEVLDDEDDEEGDHSFYIAAPEKVKCQHCGAEFATLDPGFLDLKDE